MLYLCRMGKTTDEILAALLLPRGGDWVIDSVRVDDLEESIYVNVKFIRDEVTVCGKKFKIFDFRHERTWRHLDLWQYKTFVTARIPRYKVNGEVLSLEVPWADPGERLTSLLEKKR